MKVIDIERKYNKHEDKYEIIMWIEDMINHCNTPITIKEFGEDEKDAQQMLNWSYANKLLKSWNK